MPPTVGATKGEPMTIFAVTTGAPGSGKSTWAASQGLTLLGIAARADTQPDTVKKWRGRHDDFPKPRWTVGGNPAWAWEEVLRWLQATGRAPHTLRYREYGGPTAIVVEGIDGADEWQPLAIFRDAGVGDWRPEPTAYAIAQVGGNLGEARNWAHRLLQGWDKARADWVAAHPDEPMPAHLTGA